jgi:hypothetical protein
MQYCSLRNRDGACAVDHGTGRVLSLPNCPVLKCTLMNLDRRGSGHDPFIPNVCPSGAIVRQIDVRFGSYLDAIQIVCEDSGMGRSRQSERSSRRIGISVDGLTEPGSSISTRRSCHLVHGEVHASPPQIISLLRPSCAIQMRGCLRVTPASNSSGNVVANSERSGCVGSVYAAGKPSLTVFHQ